jgi:hypothetical protein
MVFRMVTDLPVRDVARRITVRGPLTLPVRGVTALLLARDGVLPLRGAPPAFPDALARLWSGASARLWRVATRKPNRVAAQMADTVTTARGVSLIGISGLPILLVDERPEILIDHDQLPLSSELPGWELERIARSCAASACGVRTGPPMLLLKACTHHLLQCMSPEMAVRPEGANHQ